MYLLLYCHCFLTNCYYLSWTLCKKGVRYQACVPLIGLTLYEKTNPFPQSRTWLSPRSVTHCDNATFFDCICRSHSLSEMAVESGSHWKAARTVRSLSGWVGRKLSPSIPSFPSGSSAPLTWDRSLRNSSICNDKDVYTETEGVCWGLGDAGLLFHQKILLSEF